MKKILWSASALMLCAVAVIGAVMAAGSLRNPISYAELERERAGQGAFLKPTPLGVNRTENEAAEIEARDDWFYGQRAFPDKRVGSEKMARAQAQARAIGRDIAPAEGGPEPGEDSRAAPTKSLSWTSIGPRPIHDGAPSPYNGTAPWAGRVTSIANHPTTSATAYVGGANGGVWKTTNDGVNWTPVFDSQPSLAIGAIAIAPSAPTTLFVGTGESNFGADSYFGAGIFKSTNSGTSWTKVGGTTFDKCHIADIIVKPGTTGSTMTLFAAVHPYGRNAGACAAGVYRSTNGGTSWTYLLSDATPTDLAFKPGSPNTIYAAFWQYGVYKTIDGGNNWDFSGLNFGRDTDGDGVTDVSVTGRIALSTTKASGATGRVFASIMDADPRYYGSLLGTFHTADSGGTWNQTASWSNYCGYPDDNTGGQCSYDIAIAASPTSATTIYGAGIRLMSGTTTGSAWTTLGFSASGIHVDIHALTIDAANRLWVGSDGGVWRKAATGTTFTNLNNTLSLTQFTTGTSGSTAGRWVGGTQDNGSMHRLASTGRWYEFNPGDGGHSAVTGTGDNTVYSSYIYATLYKSTDGGANNTCIFTSSGNYAQWCSFYTGGDQTQFYTPFEMHPNPASSARLYVGTNRIWRSTNAGTSWTAGPTLGGTVSAIGVGRSSTTRLYAGYRGATAGIKRSADGGVTWTAAGTLPNRVVTHIEVDPVNSSIAYATLSGFGGPHVYKTTNAGTSWTSISGNLPDSPVNALAVDTRTTPNTLYAATDVGVFWSIDGGAAWSNARTGLPNTVITDIRVDTRASKMVASTYGRGVYTVPIPSPSVRSFTPTSGLKGSSVTISGTGFLGAKSVKFGSGTTTAFTVNSTGTSITVNVPTTATTGKVAVTTGAGTAISTGTFTVTG